MLRASSQLCPFCEVRTLFPVRTPKTIAPQWQQARFASQLQKRAKPSRMQLSPKVAQSKTKPVTRRQDGPFAGLNRTRVPSTLQAQAQAAKPTMPTRSQGAKGAKRSRDAADRGPKEDPRWYKALKERRALSSVSYDSRANVKQRIAEIDDFQQFPLLPVIQNSILTQGLPGLEDITPTPAQRVAIPALLNMDLKGRRRGSMQNVAGMQQFLLAAETGSGKTLAYLLPVMDAIKRLEAQEKEEQEVARAEKAKEEKMFELEPPPLSGEEDPDVGRPRAIILVPSAELVSQVGAVLKSFSHTVKFRAALISAAYSGNVIRNRLFSPSGVDVVVATPHLLSSIAESDPDILSRVSHLVIDEADSLLDRSFSPLTSAVIDKSTPSLQQLVFCSATIPRSMDTYLRKRFPDIKRLVTPNIHAIPRRVQLGVVQVDQAPYKGNKDLACADTIWNIGRSAAEQNDDQKEVGSTKRIIVFVNEREKAIEVSKYLVSKGIDAIALNRDTLNERQSQTLAAFKGQSTDDDTKPQPVEDPMKGSRDGKRKLANTKVLVATDLGSRGIDTIAVKTVILYDVPHSTVDFIHRLGRTGRMGKRGRGIVLLGKGDRADVVKDVREGMYRGQALI
ncbi:ATP-dependent RNA helicase protein [Neofusicoccum parvum]|uniref:RNA helicase n=2 Tax=Neofusicoccum parvum TaxID=310453 RepID=R1GVZ2_BOTPV|nr:putative atp-dependent rna helicase protein [Neofusicoccum parvum UCRNP2]GME35047.1 ATP-dependent RNA helicase protein [Neofusicoccum parvum]GME61692.1 ATP-dependent RNA helicase protein [Neofusicoccum parvum]